MMKCCFDKRAWIGLGVLAAGLLVVNPRAGWVALPVLAGLACPASMLFMMRGMRRGTESGTATATTSGEQVAGDRSAASDRAAEIARLRREIEVLRGNPSEMTPIAGAAGAPTGRAAAG